MVKLVDFIIVSVIIRSEISNYVWIGVFCYLILLYCIKYLYWGLLLGFNG